MNILTLYDNMPSAKHQFEWLIEGHGKCTPSDCVKCGACEKVCPQHITIRDELDKVVNAFK
jgi:hypothetical protein